jgi:L,D-peptidoglycan transpeptidase YkuD (ErfK/YbiS/YcfS/YnhG family)
MKQLTLLGLLFLFSNCNTAQQSADYENPFQNCRQLVVVICAGTDIPAARLSYFNKTTNGWEQVPGNIPAMLGRTGLAWGKGLHDLQPGPQKKEGDGKSPAGIFRFGTAFGHLPQGEIDWKLPYVQVTESLECVDDSKSRFYNQIVDHQKVEKDWSTSERMLEVGEQYEWGVFVQHNFPPQSQGGSCIFLHVWKGPGEPTSGCTAMTEADLLPLLRWLDPAKGPLLVQMTAADYAVFQKEFGLPVLN